MSEQKRRVIKVMDRVIDQDLVRMTYTWSVRSTVAGWRFGDYADEQSTNKFWGASLLSQDDGFDGPRDISDANERIRRIWELVAAQLEPGQFFVREIFLNGQTYGLDNGIHTDRPSDEEGWYTVLVYLNPDWSIHDGGETVFYNAQRTEIILAVLPKPGRVLFFDARHPHWGRPPMRSCSDLRVTLAYRLTRLPDSPLP